MPSRPQLGIGTRRSKRLDGTRGVTSQVTFFTLNVKLNINNVFTNGLFRHPSNRIFAGFFHLADCFANVHSTVFAGLP